MPQLVTCGSEFLRINAQKNSIEYSSNGGMTWHNRFCMSSVGTFRDLLVMGADLFAATSKGLYWSRNGGATWVTRYNNSAVGEFQTLATDGAVLLAGTSKGAFRLAEPGDDLGAAEVGIFTIHWRRFGICCLFRRSWPFG